MKRGLVTFRLVALVGFVGAIMVSGCVDTVKGDDEAFLEQVRSSADVAESAIETGNVPGTTEDPDAIPVIEVETDYLDFGIIPTTGMAHDEFTVRNVGKAPLNVSDVKTTCGCTQGKIVDTTIPAGGETVVQVAVDPKRIYGYESTKTLTIYSNDPKKGAVQVKVHAAIEPEFELDPDNLDFGTLEKGEGAEKTVVMRELTDVPVGLLDMQVGGPAAGWLEVSFEERPEQQWKVPGKREYAITASIKPTAPAGDLTAQALMKLDLPRVTKYYLKVHANVEAFYTVVPEARMGGGNFGPVKPGTMVDNVIRIKAAEPFTLVSVSADKPYITLTSHDYDEPGVQAANVEPGSADENAPTVAPPEEFAKAIDVRIGEDAPAGTYAGQITAVIEKDGKQVTEQMRLVGVVLGERPAPAVAPASQELKPVVPAPPPPSVATNE